MEKINSITFTKQQKHLLPKFIDLLLEGNKTNDEPDFDIRMMIRTEEDLIVLEGADSFECDGITYVDYNHEIVPSAFSPIYLKVEEDAKYHCNIGEDLHFTEISGEKLIELIKEGSK